MDQTLIDKDQSIQKLIEYLFKKYGDDKFLLKDHWEGDRCAIGLIDPSEKFLIYISTLNLEQSGFYVELENLPVDISELPYETVGIFKNIDQSKLEKLLIEHLKIK